MSCPATWLRIFLLCGGVLMLMCHRTQCLQEFISSTLSIYRSMKYQHRGLSSSHSHCYNLRSRNDNIKMSNKHSATINSEVHSTRLMDYFFVRKRRNVSPDQESDMESFKKRMKKELMSDNDQVVPAAEQKESPQSRLATLRPLTAIKRLPPNPLGAFAAFSPEVFLTVIDRIPVAELAGLAQTSPELNTMLRCFATSGSAEKRFIKETAALGEPMESQMTAEDPFYAWGLLLKAVTITDPAPTRIDFFNVFYAKNRDQCDECGWGRCILAFLGQWDFAECARLLYSLFKTTENGLYRSIVETLDEPDGLHPDEEMKVRRRLRNLFLCHRYPDERDACFWLSAILRTQSNIKKQAKLLYILFGPTQLDDYSKEVIDWRDLCEIPVSTLESSRERLGPLSDALFRLIQTKSLGNSEFVYSEPDIFNLLEELTTCPQPWPFDNFVALLLSRTSLIPIALVFRVVHGYPGEAGQIFKIMISLLCRWQLPVVSSLESPMRQTMFPLSHFQRIALLRSIFGAVFNAAVESLGRLPAQRWDFSDEIQTAAVASPLLRLMGMMI